jgi:predicted phage terminase large subunit-like protein
MTHADITAFYQALAKKSFRHFVKLTKPDYEFNWHHLKLIEKLQAFADGKIKRLMVFMPPRHGKSELSSRRFPAWLLGRNPRAKIIATSYASELASSFNRDVQRIIDEDRYRALFPATRLMGPGVKSDQAWLRNNDIFEVVGHGGFYRSAGVGGSITGVGGDFLIIDDPIKNSEEAKSPTIRRRVFEWYTSTLYTRQEKAAGILLIQTRWHEEDLAGALLELQKKGGEFADQWEVVSFPAILENPSPEDPRAVGEALWPEKYNERWMNVTRSALGSFQFSALYQQNPTPDEGQFVRASWLKSYSIRPESFDRVVLSWDMTFGSEKKTGDFVVGAVYGKRGSSVYLLDRVRGQWDFPETVAQFKRLASKHPGAGKLVEAKANGQAVIDSLKKEIPGIVPVIPTSSKASRLSACQPYYEAGNVFYPAPELAPWIGSHIDEVVGFPNLKHDDAVDAETQALQYLFGTPTPKMTDDMTDFIPSGFDNGRIDW